MLSLFSHIITITVTRYSESDGLLIQTLESLSGQQEVKARILMLDQQYSSKVKGFCKTASSGDICFEYHSIPAKSLSFARNQAISMCKTDILLFIDSDATAMPDWAHRLSEGLLVSGAAIAGGKIVPIWHKQPGFLQRSHIVRDQYSMLDMGEDSQPVHKIIGANFAINKRLLGYLAHFNENLGRQNNMLLGGEESEMCCLAANAGLKISYIGSAVVHHQVFPERLSFSWLSRRMFFGGYSRAIRGGTPEPNAMRKKFFFWDYVALPFLIPSYLAGYTTGRLWRVKA